MATPPRSKADQRFELFLILLLWLFVGYLYLFVGPGTFFTNLVDGGGGDQGGNGNVQEDVQRRRAAAEAALSQGTASAEYRKAVKVGETVEVRLTICGAAAKDCKDSPSATSHDPDHAVVIAPTKTGGNIEVTLVSPDKEGLPEDLSGNGTKFVPANGTKRWAWSLKAERPGTYKLTARVIIHWGETEAELDTTEVPPITVEVEDTFSAWTARWAKRAGDFMNSVGGALAAQFAAVVGFLVYRHSKRNTPATAAAQALPTVPPRPAPSTAQPQPQPMAPRASGATRRSPPKPRQPVATTSPDRVRKR
ncbi:hypothetical protein ACWT_3514 [Actinoplanes sp. SE50]|uniref:hypothetical protein n=1 Tax=unclassified Actinoplanes TaxID=2626549 RepID=UPI00023EBD48|nr:MULTISPECIES: hypothetical protein [unclassified Actinoplanes]AEV84537.1 hypothetical protein ACPL_3642 [Actinoplanes sp. SE50/110]ATO82929.1 hypothetical protein ACWT_3514 [Actinoplanes sp. SE50]SLM00337.1 hypothetical protein ACSP50_3569 [Actinoplanes sp. SE50/110]